MAEGINKYGAKTQARPERRAYVTPETKVRVNLDRKKNLDLANAKRDVYAGLNQKEIATLQRIEDMHRQRKTEQINIVDENGNVVFTKNGGKGSVRLYPWESSRMEDRVLTHNHPGDNRLGNGLASRIGLPINGTDVKTGIRNNAKEIRASAQGYVYSVKRPKGGWGNISPEAVERDFTTVLRESNRSGVRYVNSAITREAAYNRQGRYNVGIQDEAMKRIAKKYGFTYTRRRMS